MREVYAKVTEVRPDRPLFVRKLEIGIQPRLQIVAVHGTCATEAQYQRLWEAMDQRNGEQDNGINVSIVAFDGFGLARSPVVSIHSRDYDNAELQKDLVAVVNQFTDDALPIFMMGHSYGPTHIFATIGQLKRSVKGLVLIGSAIKSEHLPIADGGHPIMKLPLFVLNCLQRMLTESFIKLAVHPKNAWLAESLRDENNANDMRVAKAYHNQMKWMETFVSEMPKTLVIHGADDKLIPVQCGQHLHNVIPNSTLLVVDSASHLVHMEQASKVSEALESFITEFLQ